MKKPQSRRSFLGGTLFALQTSRIASAGGLLETTLSAEQTSLDLGGRPASLMTYNGQAPGPLLVAEPGDTIRLTHINRLAEPTNLHFHGLHVSPRDNGDNSFLMLDPGESFTYELPLPSNHPGGTYWIHPHVHGLAARQVSRGLAAPLLIRGELDAIPEIAEAPDYLLMLQDFDLTPAGAIVEPSPAERMAGREGALIAAGGRVNPTLQLQSGGWVRVRVINAASSRFYRLKLEEHPIVQIATDGGALPLPRVLGELLLTPGERAELMIEGTRPPGAYRFLNLPYNRGSMGMMGGGVMRGQPETVATLVYSGNAARSTRLPERLSTVETLTRPARTRTFTLGQSMGGTFRGGMAFTINGRSFDPQRIDVRVRLGDVEDWDFVNPTGMDHPMHIHTNHFQIVFSDGTAEEAWRDVALIPAGRRVRLRTQFRDFTGKLMYHCHILDHEDMGMMGVLEVA